jgi:GDP-L-fucose synthase
VKILITGASGFIGRNLAQFLAARHQILSPPRAELDLLDAVAVRQYLEAHRFDAVVHAASERLGTNAHAGGEVFYRNCRMFFHLARNTHSFGRMLFLGSGAAYDCRHWRPRMSEAYFDTHVPADDYGFSKYVCAKAIGAMERVYELRLFGTLGPYDDWRVRFLPNACCRALSDLPIVIRRNRFFDFVDVEDVAGLVERFLTAPLRHRHYNISTGSAFELHALAAKVIAISGKNLEIRVTNEGLDPEYSGDNSRLLAEFPDWRFRAIDDSLERLFRWYAVRRLIDPALLRFDS